MKERPWYYAILTAPIRYAEDLTELQKLLYAEITALADKNGFCFASNSYFAKLYKKTPKWISSTISDMNKKWYLDVVQNREEWNLRKIFIWELKKLKKQVQVPIPLEQDSIPEKKDTPIPLEQDTLSQKNRNIIIQDNTTSVNRVETPARTNVDFVNSMRDVEIRWRQWVEYRNSSTSREDIATNEVKKELANVMKKSLEDFKSRVDKFVAIRDLIVLKKAERLFYHQIWEWDLWMFVKNFNKFYGWSEDSVILGHLAHSAEKMKVGRLLNVPQQVETTDEVIQQEKPRTEKEKQEIIAMFRKKQENIIQKTI